MAKITQITIIDENTLRLDVDAQKGDEIDLLSLNEFDVSHLRKIIDEGKDKEYEKRISEEKEKFKIQIEKERIKLLSDFKEEQNNVIENYKKQISSLEVNNLKNISELKEEQNKIIESLKLEILSLNKEKEQLTQSINEKAQLKADEEVKKYIDKINNLEKEKNNIQNEYEMKLLKLEYSIKDANNDIDNKLKEKDSEFNNKIHDLEIEYLEKLHEKENEIIRLKNNRTSLHGKMIGEDLEKWCNNEFNAYAQTGFTHCTWMKDTISVKEDGELKGTKADYIFRVFNDETQKYELTSVILEMKSEDPLSKNTKTNESHYNKLDKDRRKKNCEYALLVSELDWEQANDLPIKKVIGYEKMYMVRPKYFISFLSIVEGLANKYKELLIARDLELIKFEKTTEIIDKFEKFKDDMINTLLERVIKSVAEINKQAKDINKAADSILATCSKIIDTQIETIKNKIEKFEITKIVKKIDKLD